MSSLERERLEHMLEHARAAVRYLGDATTADLVQDDEKLSAILWRICIVGEAAASVSSGAVAANTNLPLRQAKAMRNLLIHQYPEIDAEAVARTVREDFPSLIAEIDRILAEGGRAE